MVILGAVWACPLPPRSLLVRMNDAAPCTIKAVVGSTCATRHVPVRPFDHSLCPHPALLPAALLSWCTSNRCIPPTPDPCRPDPLFPPSSAWATPLPFFSVISILSSPPLPLLPALFSPHAHLSSLFHQRSANRPTTWEQSSRDHDNLLPRTAHHPPISSSSSHRKHNLDRNDAVQDHRYHLGDRRHRRQRPERLCHRRMFLLLPESWMTAHLAVENTHNSGRAC